MLYIYGVQNNESPDKEKITNKMRRSVDTHDLQGKEKISYTFEII